MLKSERDELRKLAENANEDWRAGYSDGSGKEIVVRVGKHKNLEKGIATTNWGCGCCASDPTEEDFKTALLISALSPKRVLSLLDTIDELERRVEELKEKAWKYDELNK